MENKNPNIMPEFHLFPTIARLGHAVIKHLRFFDFEVHDYESNHYHGAAAMLDAEGEALSPRIELGQE